jgi:predicted metal-dependent enzyme (double-stranded beta helix superfamily)
MFIHPTIRPIKKRLALPVIESGHSVSAADLSDLSRRVAAADELWREIVKHDPQTRWYERLLGTDDVEVWLLGWTPDQWTDIHDHGGATGALTVVEGALTEDWYAATASKRPHPVARRVFGRGATQHFSADHIHRVGNTSGQIATSVHAYSPPGLALGEYGAPKVDRSLLAEAS